MLVEAENKIKELRISNISFRLGNGGHGWPEAAPFDRIMLTCASAEIPTALLNQLKIGGIMVAPVGSGRDQELLRITRTETGFETEMLMSVTFVPLVEDK